MGQSQLVDKLRELARNLWWTWQPNVVSLFRELDPALWRMTDHNPIDFLKRIPAEQLERRAAEMALRLADRLRLPEAGRVPQERRHLGRRPRLEPPVAAGRLLLGRVRAAREPADLLGGPRRPGRRPPQERQRPGHPPDRHRPALRPGLLPPDARRQRLAAGALPQRQPRPPADRAGARARRQAVDGGDRDSHLGVLRARVWRVEVGRTTLLLLDSNVPENSASDRALTARLYGGDARVRIRQELLLGVGGVRVLHALGITPSVLHLNEGHSAFAGLEMIRAVMEADAIAVRRGGPRRRGDDRLHDAHPRRRRARPLPRRAGRGAPGQAPRGAAPLLRRLHGAGPRPPGRPRRAVLHDRPGAEAVAARQRRQRPARPGLAADVAAALPEPGRGRACRSATSPTACTSGAGWPRRCTMLFDRHLERRLGQADALPRDLGRHPDGRRRRALGDAAGPQGPADRLRPPPPGRAGPPPRRGGGGGPAGRAGARPRAP